jgi:hypothetical protein
MAATTTDLYVRPEDGWVLAATAPAAFLLIKPENFFPWWVYVAAAPPAATTTRATGAVIFGGLPVAAETVTIGGEVFTFRAAAALPFEVTIGADANATAVNFAAAVNTYSTVVTATASLGTVTLTARSPGTAGNAVSLAEAATNTTVSGAFLTTGVDAAVGVPMGRDSNNRLEAFEMQNGTAGNVYIRMRDPIASEPVNQQARFAVVAET